MNGNKIETTLVDVPLGDHCTALLGANNGKYPDANGLLVRGSGRTALIDPTPGVALRTDRLPPIDLVLLTHVHEDHFAGLSDYRDIEVWVHEAEHCGLESLDGLLDLFGATGPWRDELAISSVEKFNYHPRPDALPFADGHVWDLGGTTIRAIHSPGHTPGHCFFMVEPDNVLLLADLDLSSFGPFYADAGSSIDDFEATIAMAQELDAKHYVTGHHKGIVDAATFRKLVDRYADVIPRRERRLLQFLDQPRSLEEIVAHRFIYRPEDTAEGLDWIEQAGMELHLERLQHHRKVRRTDDGRYVRT